MKLKELIQKAKPRRALFTTFTFSISWFEAIIIPALRDAGCEQIDVLVDARHARRSTDEASGLYIGSAYRIIPVYMDRTTVFHPKLVYLEGFDDVDRLVVSSANLTLSGHGRNFEVLDAISASQEPGVFVELADFVNALTQKYSFSSDYKEILRDYSARIRERLGKWDPIDEAKRRAWLLHTLTRSATEQLTEHAYRLEAPRTLTVLSPFHSPTGAPVQILSEKIGAGKVRIGLDGKSLHAPFLEVGHVFKKLPTFVRADSDHSDRPLHAKCFEVHGDNGVIVMSGSVNATTQSLSGTENVEVSLVRLLDDSPFSWKEIDKPKAYRPCDFDVEELTSRNPALQVSLTPENRLVGQVFPVGMDQIVTLEVFDGGAFQHCQSNVPIVKGAFDVQLERVLKSDNSLQLVVTGEDLYAIGWINVEVHLSVAPSQRELAKASARLLAGEKRDEDLDQVTNWLISLQARLKSSGGAPGTTRRIVRDGKDGDAPGHKMTYAEWRESIEQAQGFNGHSSLARNAVEAAIQWVNHDVKKRDTTPDLNGNPEGESGGTPKPPVSIASKAGRRQRPKFITSDAQEFSRNEDIQQDGELGRGSDGRFQDALTAIPYGLELDARGSIVPLLVELSATFVLKQTVNTLGSLDATGKRKSAYPYIQNWLDRFVSFDYSEQNRQALLPLFAAMACCAAEFHNESALSLSKEALVRLLGRAVAKDEVLNSATLGLASDRFERLCDEEKLAILRRASDIEESATNADVLTDIIVLTLDPLTRICPSVAPEYTLIVRALHQFQRFTSKHAFGVVRGGVKMLGRAPCCGGPFYHDDMTVLRAQRHIVCKECKRPIFYGLDPVVLEARGLSSRFKV